MVRSGRGRGRRWRHASLHVACVTVTNTYTAMRHEVRETGKRPRDAYSEMIAFIPKKFKDSATQNQICHN